MEQVRKRYQGVTNIVRFNWHFYLIAALLIALLLVLNAMTQNRFAFLIFFFCNSLSAVIFISLAVSFYIYDLSDLYAFKWLPAMAIGTGSNVVNIHAGFDETSALLQAKAAGAALTVFDFYDPAKHREVSIKRARKTLPSYPGTRSVNTSYLPLHSNTADLVCLILSAHEIRTAQERVAFFKEVNRITHTNGRIVVTEHVRDIPNFLAYNIGCFHFLPLSAWHHTFREADLEICNEIKTTPFVTTFILQKHHGTAS